mgnify:CR=1 FL=1
MGVGALFVCLFVRLPLVSGRFVVETNSITVASPDYLKGTYDSAIGNFGVPQYGGTLAGTIVYATENSRACEDFGSKDKFRSRPGGLPVIVVVDRGGKPFSKADPILASFSVFLLALNGSRFLLLPFGFSIYLSICIYGLLILSFDLAHVYLI